MGIEVLVCLQDLSIPVFRGRVGAEDWTGDDLLIQGVGVAFLLCEFGPSQT